MKPRLHPTRLFSWLCFALAAAVSVSAHAERLVLADGFEEVAALEQKPVDIVEVHRQPLFENAPFLRLRPGDKLVEGRLEHSDSGVPGESAKNCYVCSGEKYYRLSVEGTPGGPRLSTEDAPPYSILFDWDCTLENANALRGFIHFCNAETPPKLAKAILKTAQKDFPELVPEFPDDSVSPPKMVSVPGHQYYEFQGFVPNPYDNGLYRYTLRLGPGLLEAWKDVVVRGVPPAPQHRNGQDRQWQAADAKYRKFEALVRKAEQDYVASVPDPPRRIYSSRVLEYKVSNPVVWRVMEKLLQRNGTASENFPHQMTLYRGSGGFTVFWYHPETRTFFAEGRWLDQAHFLAWFAGITANSRRLLKEPIKFTGTCGFSSEEAPKPPSNAEKAAEPLKSPRKK